MKYKTEESILNTFRKLARSQHKELGSGNLFNGSYESLDTIIMESASGPYIKDISGREYIDIGMSAGSVILGHAHQKIVAKVSAQAAKGSVFVQPAKSAYGLKERVLKQLPDKYNGVVFCNSGSEATMRAIRLARAYSGKTGIAVFSGGWHGSHDAVLAGDDYASPENNPKPIGLSSGMPQYFLDDIIMLPYNRQEAFEIIRKEADRIALVMIEPVQGSNPRSDMNWFLKQLSQVCNESGVIFAFDESITGYRLEIGGAVNYFDVAPDIITYGKILGGGLPIGAVVFTEKIGSSVFRKSKNSFFTGGTFSANPMTMEAGIAVLQCLETSDYGYINKLSEVFRNTCNNYFEKTETPIRLHGCNSISRAIFTDRHIKNRRERDRYELSFDKQTLFRKLMILSGIFYPSNGLIFFSFSHNEEHIEKIILAIKDSVDTMRKIDCFTQS